jgi:hypothetical protein
VLFMMCLLVYILLIWKCVSFSLISTLFQSVCKYCLFNVVCECNYCFYSLLLQVCKTRRKCVRFHCSTNVNSWIYHVCDVYKLFYM